MYVVLCAFVSTNIIAIIHETKVAPVPKHHVMKSRGSGRLIHRDPVPRYPVCGT
jgi:PIN domain nuclease of toxin-antitoxin system